VEQEECQLVDVRDAFLLERPVYALGDMVRPVGGQLETARAREIKRGARMERAGHCTGNRPAVWGLQPATRAVAPRFSALD
jgi:hypothetical protein